MADVIESRNRDLEKAIEALAKNPDAKAQNDFIHALLSCGGFYAPMKSHGEGRERKPAFAVVTDRQKNHYYALFTSRANVKLWSTEKTALAELSFRQIGNTAQGDPRISGLVINPNKDNLILGRKLIENVLRMDEADMYGQADIPFAPGTEFHEPKGECPEMLDALREYMRGDANVSAAYLRGVTINHEECYAVIVTHTGPLQPTFSNIAKVAQDFGNGTPTAVVSSRAKDAEKAISGIMPFYRRPFVVS